MTIVDDQETGQWRASRANRLPLMACDENCAVPACFGRDTDRAMRERDPVNFSQLLYRTVARSRACCQHDREYVGRFFGRHHLLILTLLAENIGSEYLLQQMLLCIY
jgi:hypothetical protein